MTEIWRPSRDRSRLEFGDGLYGPSGEFHAASVAIPFLNGARAAAVVWRS